MRLIALLGAAGLSRWIMRQIGEVGSDVHLSAKYKISLLW